MRELRTAVLVANEVSMLRAGMQGPIVLVEGDTDTRLYRRFVLPTPMVRVTHCDGKPTLLEAMEMLRDRGIGRVLGICDADFDRVTRQGAGGNILHADFHDAEMMIVHSASFKRVCEEIYETNLTDQAFQQYRDSLLEISAKIGSIRLWNSINHARLKFKEVDAGGFLSLGEPFPYDGYLMKLLEESSNSSASVDTLLQVLEAGYPGFEAGEMACGHDFTALMDGDAALKCERDRYGANVIEKFLRASFDAASFSNTRLASELRRWEERQDVDLVSDDLME